MGLWNKIKETFSPPPFDPSRRNMGKTAAVGAVQVAATGKVSVAAEPDPQALANAEKLARIEIQDLFTKALAATDNFMDKKILSIACTLSHKDGDASFTDWTNQLLADEKIAYDTLRESIRTFTERHQKPLTFADLIPDTSNLPDGLRDESSDMTPVEAIRKKYEDGIKHLLPDRKMPRDTPLSTENIKPLAIWDTRRTEASIIAKYADKLKPTVQALLKKAEQTLPPNKAKELVHGFLKGGVELWNADGDQVKPHLDKIFTRLEKGGTTLVDRALKKQAEEAAGAAQRAAQETARFVDKMKKRFGDIVPSSDATTAKGKERFFLPLSESEEGAKNKLPIIKEILGGRRYNQEPRSIRYNDALITKELEPTRLWPKDRFVPVPTQGYVQAYGVDLSYRELEQLHDYMSDNPNIAKILTPHISDFGISEGISH